MKSGSACWLNFFYCRERNWSGGRDPQHATNYQQQGSYQTDSDGIREISLYLKKKKKAWLSLALAKTTKSHRTASLQSRKPRNSTAFMVATPFEADRPRRIYIPSLLRRAWLRDRLQNRAGGGVLVGCKELPEAFFFFFFFYEQLGDRSHLIWWWHHKSFRGETCSQKKKGDGDGFVITWPRCVNFGHVVTHGCLLWWAGGMWKTTDHLTTTEPSAIQTLP